MTIEQIRAMPENIDSIPAGCTKVHESCVRSYQVMKKVEFWCNLGTPPSVVLEMIEACYPEKKRG